MRVPALVLSLLLAACGTGGGDDGPGLPPAEAVPALEGLWCGPAGNSGSVIGAVCIKIDAAGNITRIVFEGRNAGVFGTIQTSAQPRIFRFRLSTGGAGFLQLSESGGHLLYLDDSRLLAVLDSTSPTLPGSYLPSDIQHDWEGESFFLDAAGTILGTTASSLSVQPLFDYTGLQNGIAFRQWGATTIGVVQPVFGLYAGRYEVPGVEIGDMELFMSPDKQAVGGFLCADGGTFPTACSFVLWERVP